MVSSGKLADRSSRKLTIYLVVGIVLVLLIPWARVSPASASGNPVGEIAADIALMPSVPGNDCQAVISAVQGGGTVEQYLNQAFGTDFAPVTINSGECQVLLTFVPIVGSYNDLIVAAQQYNASNPASVRNFYEKSFILAAEVMIVGFALDGTLYKASYQATGELNDGLKLGKLQSLCGDTCYADVLSAIYWFINGTATSALDGFVTWSIDNLPASVTSELPKPASLGPLGSMGAMGPVEVFMYSLAIVTVLMLFILMKRSTERDGAR